MMTSELLSIRERFTRVRLGSLARAAALVGFVTVAILGSIAASGAALAQVSSTDNFMPRSWQPGAEPAREASPKRVRRSAVTTTTRLDEFDVPRGSVSRAARSARPQRIVERKRSPRKVRVAALGNSAAVDLRPPVRRLAKAKPKARPIRLAALGGVATPLPAMRAPAPSLTGGGIVWRASSACLAGNLRSIIASVAATFGSVTVNSTCRSSARNRRVGGAKRSWHLTGNAADFRVRGANIRRVYAHLRGMVGGGLKHYGGGLFHIDNGPRRTF